MDSHLQEPKCHKVNRNSLLRSVQIIPKNTHWEIHMKRQKFAMRCTILSKKDDQSFPLITSYSRWTNTYNETTEAVGVIRAMLELYPR